MSITAVAILGLVAAPNLWVCHEEVYGLAEYNGQLFATTSAGFVNVDSGQFWPTKSPGSYRRLEISEGTLFSRGGWGVAIFNGSEWRGSTSDPFPVTLSTAKETAPPAGSGGAFLSATGEYDGRDLMAFWGAKQLYRSSGGKLEAAMSAPAAGKVYSIARRGKDLFAGTASGLYRWTGKIWQEKDLPSDLPFPRTHGLTQIGGKYVIGGIGGLCVGKPGAWETVSGESVRQIVGFGKEAWVLYGSGAVDRLDIASGKLYYDVLQGKVRRPWASCIARTNGKIMFGSHGGWIERGNELVQHYPAELKDEVVTALQQVGNVLWIGTQKSGLFSYDGLKVRHHGVAELADPWVTALATDGKQLYVGTATNGVHRLEKVKMSALEAPSLKVRQMAVIDGVLYVGALDGAWRSHGLTWQRIGLTDEVTGFAAIGEQIAVMHPTAVAFEPKPYWVD